MSAENRPSQLSTQETQAQLPQYPGIIHDPQTLAPGLAVLDALVPHLGTQDRVPLAGETLDDLDLLLKINEQALAYNRAEPHSSAAAAIKQEREALLREAKERPSFLRNVAGLQVTTAENYNIAGQAIMNLYAVSPRQREGLSVAIRQGADASNLDQNRKIVYETARVSDALGGDEVVLPSLKAVIEESIALTEAIHLLAGLNGYTELMTKNGQVTWNATPHFLRWQQSAIAVFDRNLPADNRVRRMRRSASELIAAVEATGVTEGEIYRWADDARRLMEARTTQEELLRKTEIEWRQTQQQEIKTTAEERRKAYYGITAASHAPAEWLRTSDFSSLYRVLTNPSAPAPVFTDGQLDKDGVRWMMGGIKALDDLFSPGLTDAEAFSALEDKLATENMVARSFSECAERARSRGMHLPPLEIGRGLVAKGIWLQANWETLRELMDEHLPASMQPRLDRLEWLLGRRPPEAEEEWTERSSEEVAEQGIGKAALRESVKIVGELSWEPLPPEILGPRDAMHEDVRERFTARIRSRPGGSHAEQARIDDFIAVYELFGGEVWETNFRNRPGVVHLFEYGDSKFVLGEWFARERASYVFCYDEELDWEKVFRLHKRELRALGGQQIVHPVLAEGEYKEGDHQVAILAAVEDFLNEKG